jgi:hypothetical protein
MSRQLYARVFTQILDSSLAENWQTRHVFEDLLKLADDGVVDMTRQAIARRTNVPLEVVNTAIGELEAQDPASRDAAEQGRRLMRLDDHRDWGWSIVNWEKYEAIKSTADQREQARERKRRQREREQSEALPPNPLPKEQNQNQNQLQKQKQRTVTCHGMSRSDRDIQPERAAGAAPTSGIEDDASWFSGLKKDKAFEGKDVDHEHAKALRWCAEHHKQLTRRRFVNWLNRTERPIVTISAPKTQTPKQPSQFIPT